MQRPKMISDVIWNAVELLTGGGEFEVWSREDGIPFPILGEQQGTEQDPDDLFPESEVTKQFWRNLYRGIEQLA